MFAMKGTRQQSRDFASSTDKQHEDHSSAPQTMTNTSLFLQRNLGNSYLQSLASGGMIQRKCACGSDKVVCEECAKKNIGLQRKLTIGSNNDPLEQEADRVAEQMVSAPLNSAVNTTPPRIQRFSGQASEGSNTAPDSVNYILAGSGRPLEPMLRQDMERRFGHDFSRVRVHVGDAAEQSARAVNANAYTAGHNIVFGAGQFAPRSQEGRRLIAHELTHVVQQAFSQGASPLQIQRDLAIEPQVPGTEPSLLTEEEIQNAIDYNRRRFEDPFTIRTIRDVMGMEPYPAIITREFVLEVVRWQAERPPLRQDGMVGPETTQSFIQELVAENEPDLVRQLRLDNFVRVTNISGPTFNECIANACANTVCTGNAGLGFCWEVAFTTSLRNGFIVQRIDNTWNETPPPGQPAIVQTPRYWEAWNVDGSGNVTPRLCGINDVWARNTRSGSRGDWRMTAKLYTVINLPAAAGFAPGNVPDAAMLQSTTTAPNPDALGLPVGYRPIEVNETPRTIGGQWDCTNANPALNFHRRF